MLNPYELLTAPFGGSVYAVSSETHSELVNGSTTVTALRAVFDGPRAAVRDDVRQQLGADFLPAPDLTRVEHRRWVNTRLNQLRDHGFPDAGFTQDDGGTGETGKALTAFEMLGYADLSVMVKAGVQWGLFGGAVSNLGSVELRSTFVPGIMSLEIMGCFAMTELSHGSDVANIDTTATYHADTEEFMVHSPGPGATKVYIGGAAQDARWGAVFAQLVTGGPGEKPDSRGVHCLMVPLRSASGDVLPGVTISDHGPKGGLPGVDNGRISFDSVRVPRSNLLDRFGAVAPDGSYSSPIEHEGKRFFTMLGTLIRGRVSVAGAAGAATRLALYLAVTYAHQRTQFRRPDSTDEVRLIEYRTHQRRLMAPLARSVVYAIAQNSLVDELDAAERSHDELEGVSHRQLEARAAGLKALVSEHALQTVAETRLACGGAGYMSENRIVDIYADVDIFATFEGDNTVLFQLVAKDLLTAYSKEIRGLDMLGTVRFATSTFGDIVSELTNASQVWQRLVDSVTDREKSEFLDRGTQLKLLADRRQHLLETAARRLQGANRNDVDPFDAFNNAQDHIVACGRAEMELYAFERYVEAIDGCPDPEAERVLGLLCDLYVLDIVVTNRAWFIEHARLTTERAKAAVALHNELCRQVADVSCEIVEAFGIPTDLTDVPMLNPDAPAHR